MSTVHVITTTAAAPRPVAPDHIVNRATGYPPVPPPMPRHLSPRVPVRRARAIMRLKSDGAIMTGLAAAAGFVVTGIPGEYFARFIIATDHAMSLIPF